MNRTFKASPTVRAAFLLVYIAAPVLAWWLRDDEVAMLLDGMYAVGVIAVFFAWPRTIHFDTYGIWQRNLLGRKQFIQWNDVDSLAHIAADGKTVVAGGTVNIVHGTLHRDKQQFCDLIEQRTSRKMFVGMLDAGSER